MSIAQQFLALDKEVSRFVRETHFGRGLAAFGMTVIAVVFGTVASAAPILSFDSVEVTADGINPTTVQVLVEVDNQDLQTYLVDTLATEYSVSVSGGPQSSDLTLTSGTPSNPGVFVSGSQPQFSLYSGGWGVDTNGTDSTLGLGVSNVATLTFQVAAGITSGVFTLDFLTDLLPNPNPFRAFSVDNGATLTPYANGNNGQAFPTPGGTGVITVVPEASSSVILASGALLATGLGLAQRRARRGSRRPEIAG